MAITALTGLVAEWFTPKSQEGEPNPARFKVNPLNGEQCNNVMHGVEFGLTKATLSGEAVRDILAIGLTDWEGVEDSDGAALECERGNHKFLPPFLRIEIASEIFSNSFLTGDEKKT